MIHDVHCFASQQRSIQDTVLIYNIIIIILLCMTDTMHRRVKFRG